MKSWRSLKIYLWLVVSAAGIIGGILAQPEQALASKKEQDTVITRIKTLRETEFPATSIKDLLSQSPTPDTQSIVLITGVKTNPTDKGVEVILETVRGDKLQVANRSTGNNFIVDVIGGQLRLSNGDAFTFKSEKPLEGITQITVTNIDANTVRVTVVGEKALPAIELFDGDEGLIFAVVSTTTSAQQPETPQTEEKPATEKPEETPAAQQDELIELVVTGEQDSYRVPDTSVGTRTDTPLRDIPQSIQVVPQQVLQDRQARSITDGLENVSGVTSISTAAGSRDVFTIRGFANYGNALVNGLPGSITSDGIFINVERLEVLKGPASVLYGEILYGGLGGIINYVTKQPLRDPFYEVSATIGSFNDYQGTIDFSGPLNDSKTALYRFNTAYRSNETFVDFNEFTQISIAPSLSLNLGKNTDLLIEGDITRMERNGQQPDGPPAVGTILPNPNGKVRRSFNSTGPVTDNLTIVGNVGYRLEHQFNENWKLRNAFRYQFYDDDDRDGKPYFFPTSLEADNRTLNRLGVIGSQFYDTYYLDTNLLGKFNTGSINHQLLVGFSLNRFTVDSSYEDEIPAAPVDIFSPVYDQTIVSTGVPNRSRFTTRDTLGIYLQDQITLAENLKLLLGGRVDFFEERETNRITNVETSQSDTAFSPRVGIVYQPIQAISLYASFAQSFQPTIGTSASGEAFEPERGTQYEVGIKADLSSKLSTTLAFYDLTRTNVTTTDPDNPNFSIQTGEQKSRGIELDISGEILPGWNIIAGYAYNDAKVTEDNDIPVGNRLFAAPKHSFNLWTTYRIQQGDLQGLGFGLGFYYVGETAGNLANTFEVPSYFRTDAAIFYERDQFRAALNFRNLFDVEYYRAIGSETLVGIGEPFTIQGTISWRF
ncbi:MAG: TonB-dependent siderophore receptor [Pelatocladus maniniholoensis HA4357-MV3]|jgi:iron complex outermembrane receptor protein|uniref:TonB-dependent siderophore receptor n=1 Tax=Pelatocladus maniniholoensis HA4357-MV3 TaxID=1117104 RepID=A0A9E3H6M6_9NOST|nr:TonB-dependent siderophore receptor [Pelatocladus maniniholoensis HA4357-MV3]